MPKQSLEQNENTALDMIPGLEGAAGYYAIVNMKGMQMLAKLGDDNKWRAVSEQEITSIMGGNQPQNQNHGFQSPAHNPYPFGNPYRR